MRKSGLSTPALILTGLSCLVFAAAQWQPEVEAKTGPLGKTLYDPSSGSYFEVIQNERGTFSQWRHVRTAAKKRFYKGIRGRLAVINTRATHEFLRKNFGNTIGGWIGLRYHCATGKLVWVTGEILRRGVDFEIWHKQLYYEKRSYCETGHPYLVVFYVRKGKRLYWRLSGPDHFKGLAVFEYPTR